MPSLKVIVITLKCFRFLLIYFFAANALNSRMELGG